MSAADRRVWVALAGALVSGLISGCREKPPGAAHGNLPSAVVQVRPATLRKAVAAEEVAGTVRSRLRSVVEAKVSGRIERMRVTQGQPVKLGELLAELDVREIQARRDQAAAAHEQAERDLKRFHTLLEQKVITQAEFDSTLSRQRIAAAAVAEAETLLGYARITAPFDGLVVRKLSDVGDLAAPGKPLLELEQPTALRLEADVPEALIGHLLPGAKLPVRIPALSREAEATVTEIAPAADPGSRTVLVKLDLPPLEGLRSGLFGRVAIPAGEEERLEVPPSALVRRGQMEIVFVVEEGHARLRLVRTGRWTAEAVAVIAGLSAGDSVVVDSPATLVDGQPVKTRN
jgi:RND family efflux transporter MFP subunit